MGGTTIADLDGARPFVLLMDAVQESVEHGTSRAEPVVDAAVQIWVALHGLVVLRADAPHFPWPDAELTEIELIRRLGRLTDRPGPCDPTGPATS